MTEFSESDKVKLFEILEEMDCKLNEVKPKCTNEVQRGCVKACEEFLDKYRVVKE